MATPPQLPPGYTFTESSPNMPPHQPARRPPPPPFSSPVAARFSSHGPQQDSHVSPANGIRNGSPVPQFNTPPGPPVFSSPVQPAAVPFRASPLSPQPVASSSVSPLPASSAPFYSNGLAELQSRASVSSDESTLDGASPHVLFSAHKVADLIPVAALYRELGESGNEMENLEYERKKADDLQKRILDAQSTIHHLELVDAARIQVKQLHEVDMKRAIAGPSTKVNLDIPESVGLFTPPPTLTSARLRDIDASRRGKKKI